MYDVYVFDIGDTVLILLVVHVYRLSGWSQRVGIRSFSLVFEASTLSPYLISFRKH